LSLAKLESDLLRVREDLGKVREVNTRFGKIIEDISSIKERALADPSTKKRIIEELKHKEIIDIFSGIEHDFEDLRTQLSKQDLNRERISDFVESLRTRKNFSFTETTNAIIFLEQTIDVLQSSHITIKPEFIGLIDLGSIAIELGVYKSNASIIVERERFSEALAALLSRKMLHNIIIETDNARVILHSSKNILIETDNSNLKKISRIERE
jgi:hypothetical protein